MGIANRVINILVLVAAIAVVVFAFMLFNKREQLVDGWKKMAESINKTSAVLDDGANSGTAVSKELTVSNLDHTKYDTLSNTLKKLDAQSKEIIAQRNELADSLSAVATTLEVGTETDAADLKKIASSSDSQTSIQDKVKKVQERNDGLVEEIVKLSKQIEAPVKTDELKSNDTYVASMGKVSKQVGNLKTRNDNYHSHIVKVAETLELPSKPSLDGDDYADSLKKAHAGVQEVKNAFETTKRDLASEKEVSANLKTQIQKKHEELTAEQAKAKKHADEVARLTNIINGGQAEAGAIDTVSTPAEIKKLIRGQVVYVDQRFGFVTIDIGSQNKVTQKIGKGNFEQTSNAPVAADEVMTIAHNMGTPDAKFAGRIRIIKVTDNAAIANILPSPVGAVAPQKGDTVYFSEDDIDVVFAKKAADAAKVAAPIDDGITEETVQEDEEIVDDTVSSAPAASSSDDEDLLSE